MDKSCEDILKKAFRQAITNSMKRTNVFLLPRGEIETQIQYPSFLTKYLRKPMGRFIDLWIKEINERTVVFFQLENYKKTPRLDVEQIFNQGVFWTAFFNVESYKSIPVNINNFNRLVFSDQVLFLKKYIK